jgi:hypothetical protein
MAVLTHQIVRPGLRFVHRQSKIERHVSVELLDKDEWHKVGAACITHLEAEDVFFEFEPLGRPGWYIRVVCIDPVDIQYSLYIDQTRVTTSYSDLLSLTTAASAQESMQSLLAEIVPLLITIATSLPRIVPPGLGLVHTQGAIERLVDVTLLEKNEWRQLGTAHITPLKDEDVFFTFVPVGSPGWHLRVVCTSPVKYSLHVDETRSEAGINTSFANVSDFVKAALERFVGPAPPLAAIISTLVSVANSLPRVLPCARAQPSI